jgi:hypothetical protein
MKTPLLLLSICALIGASFLLAGPMEEKPFWHSDWPTAQRIAKKLNKPVFAVFVCQH